jgi:spore germination protein YaaH
MVGIHSKYIDGFNISCLRHLRTGCIEECMDHHWSNTQQNNNPKKCKSATSRVAPTYLLHNLSFIAISTKKNIISTDFTIIKMIKLGNLLRKSSSFYPLYSTSFEAIITQLWHKSMLATIIFSCKLLKTSCL